MAYIKAVGEPFDEEKRLEWAKAALNAALESATAAGGAAPPDLVAPDGWRWRVLDDLNGLSGYLNEGYDQARTRQKRQFWQSRFGGPIATGGGAAVGSIVSAVGAGLVKTTTAAGWIVVVLGVILAIAGSVFSSNNYVQNKNKMLRYLRLLHDLWDYCYMVLPSATASDAFVQLDAFRQLWESAGV